MGQASLQPMVITTSAACTLSAVSGLGNSREMSRPISAMAWTTAGLSWLAGCDPAEVTRTRPAAWWSSSAAAIWDRPALWVQTNRTSGKSDMAYLLLVSQRAARAARRGPGWVAGASPPRRAIRVRQRAANRGRGWAVRNPDHVHAQ